MSECFRVEASQNKLTKSIRIRNARCSTYKKMGMHYASLNVLQGKDCKPVGMAFVGTPTLLLFQGENLFVRGAKILFYVFKHSFGMFKDVPIFKSDHTDVMTV